MIERVSPPNDPPVPLSVAAGQRIVMPGLDPVLGWIGGENARAAQPLVFPQWLLEPRPTEAVVYACNLPAPASRTHPEQSQAALPGPAGSGDEASFLAASLPGGQAAIVTAGSRPAAIAFRWVWVSASVSMGTVWRCFARLRTPSTTSPWTCNGYDYVFDPASGFLVSMPGSQRIELGGSAFKLMHPDGGLTCFPSHSGRVKVTRISPDGWVKRQLLGLWLYPGRSIVARFSDGSDTKIATAAPARSAAILAA